MVSASFALSAWVMLTRAGSPATDTTVPAPSTPITSLPLVPMTVAVSTWPSPVVPPSVPARLIATWVTSVPLRSLTVMASTPPRALKSMRSTSLRSIVTLAILRKKSTRPPLAEMVDVFGDDGPVELKLVQAGLALEGVVVVARVPDEHVVARAHEGGIVAVAAVEQVAAFAAEEDVFAETAVHRQLDSASLQA